MLPLVFYLCATVTYGICLKSDYEFFVPRDSLCATSAVRPSSWCILCDYPCKEVVRKQGQMPLFSL